MWRMSTRTHGAIDYAASAAMLALPVGLKWEGRAGHLLRAAGFAAVVYSFFTNYERGMVRALPMKAHLALDAVSGVTLIGAAALMTDADDEIRATLAGVGAFEIAAALLTEPASSTEQASGGMAGTKPIAGTKPTVVRRMLEPFGYPTPT